ncbi:MAG: hypothetical protein R3F55_15965 [Alphaproteobacteria bacterium]
MSRPAAAATRRNAFRALVLGLLALAFAPAGAWAQAAPGDAATRSPSVPEAVPAPEVVAVVVGTWEAQIPDAYGGMEIWRLVIAPGGDAALEVTGAAGAMSARAGRYQIDSRTIRLIVPGQADETDPNSTALNLQDAHSLETYFYRLLGPDRLAFRPTLCRVDPCQWIAERVE